MIKKILVVLSMFIIMFYSYSKDKVIVLDIESKSVEAGILDDLKKELVTIIEEKSNLVILKISDINKIESEVFNMKSEDVTLEYQNKIKKKLKTKYIILCNVEKLYNEYNLYLKFIDINSSEILFIIKLEEKNINEIKNKLNILLTNIKKININKNDKKSLVILEVNSNRVDGIIKNKIYNELLYNFIKSEKYNIYDRISLDKIITAVNVYSITVGKKKIAPIEIGELESSELALLGNINKLGEQLLINYRIINIETGESIISNAVKIKDISEFTSIIEKQIGKL